MRMRILISIGMLIGNLFSLNIIGILIGILMRMGMLILIGMCMRIGISIGMRILMCLRISMSIPILYTYAHTYVKKKNPYRHTDGYAYEYRYTHINVFQLLQS
jgi:hypothetical protein